MNIHRYVQQLNKRFLAREQGIRVNAMRTMLYTLQLCITYCALHSTLVHRKSNYTMVYEKYTTVYMWILRIL